MSRDVASDGARPAWGALALLALLACVIVGLGIWHLDASVWRAPGASRWFAAAFVLFFWLALVAGTSGRRERHAQAASSDLAWTADTMLIAFASQTGAAEELARRTADSLQQAGMAVRLIELGELDGTQLAQARRALFLVSTTGEGDAPDSAARFVTRPMNGHVALGQLQFGLLALGDSAYDDFCGFGRRLQQWLQRGGATTLFDPVEVDNGDPAALRHWQHHLSLLSGATDGPDWERPAYQRWRLIERRLLNPDSLGGPCFHLALRPLDGEATWQAGDLVEIGPRHTAEDVARWLQQAGCNGEVVVSHEQRHASLAEWLAGSHLPAPEEVAGRTPQAIVASLSPLPHREYSIASIPDDGALHLLVRRMERDDGSFGLGSGWLTLHAAVGGEIALRIRSHPAFHAPRDGCPLILIGNGTGLAGLRALLKARIARGHARNWLLFGERQSSRDFHHGEEILAWQRQGMLSRLDLAWSRDGLASAYVQDRLRDAADTLRQWVGEGAAIYVCGSLAGMAPGVDAVLRETLGDEAVERLREQRRYRREVY
ncbi:sulfite reductase flavoprotein subunit alpha [Dyella solisilvae]|uniref:NADPH--hemoprotein reductase n=1 Tax=Dyella solisilvae TaxID=1920168 RepID=A0A370KBQ3_9GAMM|nr:sulfite reductase flavoprotein subunit alpha [Dyella solisilvae]RDJ00083.1 sulfite reductase flavoprotein subunit alpha [Dyella solisilvae]